MSQTFRSNDRQPRRFRPTTTTTAPRACVAEALEGRRLMTVPAGFSETQFGGALAAPTAMQFAPDGRLFVSQKGGQLRVITQSGNLLGTAFATLPVQTTGERGLLGVTFDPDYATNRFVYVYWTTSSPAVHNVISRFTASAANPNVAEAGSRVDLFHLPNSVSQFHNGGALHFGADGKLYAAVGDGAGGGAANAQNVNHLFGKMLRLNKDGTAPADNPFFTDDGATQPRDFVWAYGLRNPFTFAVQRGTGKIHINDVGQDTWEEINVGARGANYGWPNSEGPTSNPAYTSPLYAYRQQDGGGEGSAITGGTFYNPPTSASSPFDSYFFDDYFFTDLSAGWIKRRDAATTNVTTFATGIFRPVDLKVGPDGSLFYLSIGVGSGDGKVVKITRTGSTRPSISDHPDSQTVGVGEPVTFAVTASGSGLSYQWQRNEVNIPGATSRTYTLASPQAGDDAARFRVVVSNNGGSVTSDTATLSVTNNQAPQPVIDTPTAGTTFAYGQSFDFTGSGTDAEDGTLGDAAFTWRVDYVTGGQVRPHVEPTPGASGSFTLATSPPYTGTDVSYRLVLTATDSGGRSTTVTRDLSPRIVNITLAANVPGLRLTLDGQPVTAPVTRSSVEGFVRPIGATSPQTLNGTTYTFANWSDGGAATHNITVPAANATYTATFTASAAQPGLRAQFWNNSNFTGTSVTRVDPKVDVNWGAGSPHPSIGVDSFSSRWTGKINIPTNGTYTFYSKSNNGFRLWVNGVQIINKWSNSFWGDASGRITLTAGKKDIRVEHFDYNMNAFAHLSWSGPGIGKQIIPASRFTQT